MFLKNSRYSGLPTVTAKDRSGADIAAVKLRPLPVVSGDEVSVKSHDQLDVISEQRYADATRYWHIADAKGGESRWKITDGLAAENDVGQSAEEGKCSQCYHQGG